MPPQQPKVNRFKELDVELDGTFKRGGIPLSQLKIKDGISVSDKETHQHHGQRIKLTEVVAGAANTHFCQLSEYMIGIRDVTISRGVQLPQASIAGVGKIYVIKDMSGSAAATTVTISPVDGETIDGDTGDTLNGNYGENRYFCNGSNWFSW